MRSNLLGMCSAVAAVAVAGSASAGFIDPFTVAFDTNVVTVATSGASRFTTTASPNALIGPRLVTVLNTGSRASSTGNGAANFILGQATSGTGDRKGQVQMQWGLGSAVDLGGPQSFSMNVGSYSGAETTWFLRVSSGPEGEGAIEQTLSSSAISSGVLTFASMIDQSTVDPDNYPAFNWAQVTGVQLYINRASLGADGSTVSFSISDFQYNAVPAPGALALLGAAGLVGVRRRRN
jgi:MYXO-CTERM domain-containing protein